MVTQNDFSLVWVSGATLLTNPVESSSIFLVAAALSASIEYLFEISADVDSEYYQELFEVITEESLVFGVVQLFMIFINSLTNFRESWSVMLNWVQLLMIGMSFFLIVFVLLVASHNASEREYWHTFETQRMSSSANQPNDRERLYARCVKKFRVSLMAHQYTAEQQKSLHFCEYLEVIEKKHVVHLMDLNWKSWLSMLIPATLNALRAGALSEQVNNNIENAGSIISQFGLASPYYLYLLQGYIAMFVYSYLASTLHRRLNQYLDLGSEGMEKRLEILDYNANEPVKERRKEVEPFQIADLQDPTSFLIWQNLETTLTLVQVCLLQLVWFYAVLVITQYGAFFQQPPGWAVSLTILSLFPGLVIWRGLSWTITLISVLSSVETQFDRNIVDGLVGITKEMRQEEAAAKEAEEKAKEEEAQKKEREEAGLGEKPEMNFDEEGRVKTVVLQKKPVQLADDVAMSRIAVDRRTALQAYEELEGL